MESTTTRIKNKMWFRILDLDLPAATPGLQLLQDILRTFVALNNAPLTEAQIYVQLRKRFPHQTIDRRALNTVVHNGIRGKTFERFGAKALRIGESAFRMYQTQKQKSISTTPASPPQQALRRGDILACVLQTYIAHGNPQWGLPDLLHHVSKQFPQYTFIRSSLGSLMARYYRKYPYFQRVSKGVYTLREEYAEKFAMVKTEELHPVRPPGRRAASDTRPFAEADIAPPCV